MKYLAWPDVRHLANLKYRWCVRCGAAYDVYEMDFEGATVAPTVGETLTGATSAKTSVVSSVTKASGTYAAGTARGTIVVTSPSGEYTDGESINGSTSGAAFLTCRAYIMRRYGHLYPDSMLAAIDGKDYCIPHSVSHAKSVLYDRDGRVDIDDSTY
jgi:hypothetical protein